MPLSKEQLLAPRYKVIADYPGSQYSLNHIIELHYNINSVVEGQIKFYDHYPHLFQKLEWWQGRSKKDLPDHVKLIKGDNAGKVGKVLKWDIKTGGDYDYAQVGNFCWPISAIEPATLEEYTQYINSKQ